MSKNNSIDYLKEILEENKPKKIFLVTGKSSYVTCGAKEAVENIIKDFDYFHFDDFHVNPGVEDVREGIKLFKENNCDFVIAVGGGSVIDIAKSINLLAFNPGDPEGYIMKKKVVESKGCKLVAIPTTAGTGSEVTQFAVVYVDGTKYSLDNKFLLPDYFILDSNLTMSLPKKITACTGMDAFTQSIESYWNNNSTDESKKYAAKSIKLIMGNLRGAVNNPSKGNRENMMLGANLSGKAINITRTTACHAISYPITSFFNVPHGHAVSLTLASILKYNCEVCDDDILDKGGVEYVKNNLKELIKLIGAKDCEEASEKIIELMEDINLSTKLSKLGVNSDKDIDLIVENGFNPERVKNNPRTLTKEALRNILVDLK